MTPEDLKPHLRGPLAFPITPFLPDGSLDVEGFGANVEWLAGHDLRALVTPSGTGELFSLTPDECALVVATAIDAVDGKLPIIAGVGFGSAVAADLARRAEAAGAAGILVLPPYYGQPDPDGLLAYYEQVAAATRLAIVPYARDSAAFTPSLVERMARQIPTFVAFKDGRGDIRLFQQIRERVSEQLGPERLVWLGGTGDDLVGPYFAAGADGFTSSLACFWPEASAKLYGLASAGEFAALAAFHKRVVRPIYELRQRGRGFEVSIMKAAMEILGHHAGPVRPPLCPISPADREELSALLAALAVPTAADRQRGLVASVPVLDEASHDLRSRVPREG